jgi:hypothetical protein
MSCLKRKQGRTCLTRRLGFLNLLTSKFLFSTKSGKHSFKLFSESLNNCNLCSPMSRILLVLIALFLVQINFFHHMINHMSGTSHHGLRESRCVWMMNMLISMRVSSSRTVFWMSVSDLIHSQGEFLALFSGLKSSFFFDNNLFLDLETSFVANSQIQIPRQGENPIGH